MILWDIELISEFELEINFIINTETDEIYCGSSDHSLYFTTNISLNVFSIKNITLNVNMIDVLTGEKNSV